MQPAGGQPWARTRTVASGSHERPTQAEPPAPALGLRAQAAARRIQGLPPFLLGRSIRRRVQSTWTAVAGVGGLASATWPGEARFVVEDVGYFALGGPQGEGSLHACLSPRGHRVGPALVTPESRPTWI